MDAIPDAGLKLTGAQYAGWLFRTFDQQRSGYPPRLSTAPAPVANFVTAALEQALQLEWELGLGVTHWA